MSKTRIFALTMVAIMLAAILSNPKKERIQDAVRQKATSLLEEQLHYKDREAVQLGMTLFGNKVVNDFVEQNVIVENYYLFSLAKIRWQGQETPIGGGAFTMVWLSPKIDEKADEIISILKNL